MSHREVVTVPENAPLRIVAEVLERESVGCVVVVDADGRAIGLATDRDLAVRALTRRADPQKTLVRDVMSTPLVSVGEATPRREAELQMRRHGVRRVPVVDEDGKPVGLLSVDDLFKDLGLALADVGAAYFTDDEPRDAEGRRHLEERVSKLRQSLREANWRAQSAILGEIDELKERAFRVLEKFE